MKSTGIVRKVDGLGRIVLPIELRRTYELKIGDAVEIYTEDDKIILKKFQRTCIFCGSSEQVVEYKDRSICADCLNDIKGK
ncbi:MAG: AbrB/MazE/SpoVT family DNA-binding domain-containing protein [Ruminococcus sp.]|nr:AbrB/MazE/SpoVT family DNA-binding domain-containing protein [Ruminococcus sp.]MBQ7069681.1 AbrB/MazE/SpoVT family DNA-binding domain-containing protein [Ruminococcus sp.]